MKTFVLAVLFATVAGNAHPAEVGGVNEPTTQPPSSATEAWAPVPPIITAEPGQPPSDAIVLFDGSDLDAWESAKTPGQPAPWKLQQGLLVCRPDSGNIRTKAAFGDIQLHLEFRTPAVVTGSGQKRGNSGVFFMGRYELQILDSYDNKTYINGQAGAIYKQHAPLVNASRAPGTWQTYDVVWIAPRFDPAGRLLSPARATVFQNGVVVQHDVVLRGSTANRGAPAYQAHAPKLPLELQDHDNPIAFRNIWVREIALP